MISDRDSSELTGAELVDELRTLERVFANQLPAPTIDPRIRWEDLLDEVYARLLELDGRRD